MYLLIFLDVGIMPIKLLAQSHIYWKSWDLNPEQADPGVANHCTTQPLGEGGVLHSGHKHRQKEAKSCP